jgi:hypothetical protein
MAGNEPDCRDDDATACSPTAQSPGTPGIWNPLPYFDTVKADGELGNIRPLDAFYAALKTDSLPAVSWIAPNEEVSEHPPSLVSNGEAHVTRLINAVMHSKAWKSTAIFVTWDDWGGFYDHVVPPKVDVNGYGLRVPGLVVSPFAKRGHIDHQIYSFDAYIRFIEDDFLGGIRLDPATDGRPDHRPSVREKVAVLGDLRKDFDFRAKPRPPHILPVAVHGAGACGGWPTSVEGPPPAMTTRLPLAAFVWHDAIGWHIRVSTSGRPTAFRGRVVVSGPSVKGFSSPTGAVAVEGTGNEIRFSGQAGVPPQGIDLDIGMCATTSLQIEVDGAGGALPAAAITLGAAGTPVTNPVGVDRQRS